MKKTLLVGGACGVLFFAAAQPASAQLEPVIDLLGVADTGIGMKDQPGQVTVGQPFDYILNVRNYGPSDATDVRVQVRLADSLNFVSASGEVLPEAGDPPPQVVEDVDCGTPPPAAKLINCRIDRLEGGVLTDEGNLLELGQRAQIEVRVTPTAVGFPKSRASVESQNIDINPGNNSTQEGTSVRKAPAG